MQKEKGEPDLTCVLTVRAKIETPRGTVVKVAAMYGSTMGQWISARSLTTCRSGRHDVAMSGRTYGSIFACTHTHGLTHTHTHTHVLACMHVQFHPHKSVHKHIHRHTPSQPIQRCSVLQCAVAAKDAPTRSQKRPNHPHKHTKTHNNSLQHTVPHCNALQRAKAYNNMQILCVMMARIPSQSHTSTTFQKATYTS